MFGRTDSSFSRRGGTPPKRSVRGGLDLPAKALWRARFEALPRGWSRENVSAGPKVAA
jgi:hypothetical protein